MTGNSDELNIHMNAVEKMVSMRGGFHALGMSGTLHMVLTWYEYVFPAAPAVHPPLTF